MIANFDDFCTWMYVIIDDIWAVIAPQIQRPGPTPTTGSDSELVAMILIAECCGWDLETTALAEWRKHRALFPRQPSQSRFNRRHRLLMGAINQLRQVVVRSLDLAQDRQCVIDSLPVPAVQFHLAPQASPEWAAHGAAFGKVSSKKLTIYGDKLHVLITLNGVIKTLNWHRPTKPI